MYVPAVDVSTEPEVVTDVEITPSTSSEALNHRSVNVSPTVRFIVEDPANAIAGAVVSAAALTITIRCISGAAFPAASETLYDNMYVPAVDVSTEPEVVTDDVITPSTSSEALNPGSVNVSPTVRFIVEDPANAIDGAVVSAAALTITIL